MKTQNRWRKACLVVAVSSLSLPGVAQSLLNETVHDGVVRVKISPQLSKLLSEQESVRTKDGVVYSGVKPMDALHSKVKAVSMKRLFPHNEVHAERHRKHGLDRWYEISYSEGLSPMTVAANYESLGEIDIAEPAYQVQLIGANKVGKIFSATDLANDPYLGMQWHYHNPGDEIPALPGADVRLAEAWKVTQGKSNVVVSIVDGGIDLSHIDLKDNLWVNEKELNGIPGHDDDGNGIVDDIHGANFINGSGVVTAHDHGTHVAGTVSATNNNGIGVSGVAGGSGKGDGVRLMSCQIFDDKNLSGGYAQAIVYGADNGAVISQNSWGYLSPDVKEQVVLDAIDYFIAEAGQFPNSPMKGGLVIFASGNNNSGEKFYPGAYEPTICVSSMGPDFKKAPYSNYGEYVDVTAPGGNSDLGSKWGVFSTYLKDRYAYMDGTSMACPHVSGVAALVISHFQNENLTASDVKSRLLTSTRDINTPNPSYRGLLGTGYIDANLALAIDEGKSPEKVENFAIEGLSQDFIDLMWSASADEDDQVARTYNIFYHTSPFESPNTPGIKVQECSNGEVKPGDIVRATISGVASNSTYYIAIQAVDRWGNSSEMSQVLTGTTNQGPNIELPESSVKFSADVMADPNGKGSFILKNSDSGILDWSATVRHSSQEFTMYSYSANPKPEVPNIATNPKLLYAKGVEQAATTFDSRATVADREEWRLGESINFIVGDEEASGEQMAATMFHRYEPFNLTHIEMLMKHDPETGPITIDIFRGNILSSEYLIHSQTFDIGNNTAFIHSFRLSEQFYFSSGIPFWVVVRSPKGNKYPFGIARESDYSGSDYCFLSTDGGKKFYNLPDALRAGFNNPETFVWDIAAVSNNGSFGEYIKLDKSSGRLLGNSQDEISFNGDASKLLNGVYRSNLIIESNDTKQPTVRQPIEFTVSGHLPKLSSVSVANVGEVFIGQQKLIDIEVANVGLGSFVTSSRSSSNNDFRIISYPYLLGAQLKANIRVAFTPSSAGAKSSVITLSNSEGIKHEISVFGMGVKEGVASVTPDSNDLPTISYGETLAKDIVFTITNTGEYPLDFAIPTFETTLKSNLESVNYNRFGYSYEHSMGANPSIGYEWIDIASSENDITSRFDARNRFSKVSLGFDFPIFDQKYDSLYISDCGALSTNDNEALDQCTPPDPRSCMHGVSTVSMTGFAMKFAPYSRVYSKRESGKYIVTYDRVQFSHYEGEITAQIVLFDNGDVRYNFKEIDYSAQEFTHGYLIGIKDDSGDNCAHISSYEKILDIDNNIYTNDVTSRSSLLLRHPGSSIVNSITPSSGTLQIGQSQEVRVSVEVKDLVEGKYSQKVPVITSSTLNPYSYLTINGEVKGGGNASLGLQPDGAVDLGKSYRTKPLKGDMLLVNRGSATAEITAINSKESYVSVSNEFPIKVDAGKSVVINLTANSESIGEYRDQLTIVSSVESNDVIVNYEIVGEPMFSKSLESVDEIIEGGATKELSIDLENKGVSPLQVTILPDIMVYTPIKEVSQGEQVGYEVIRNDVDFSLPFLWEGDIKEAKQWGVSYFHKANIGQVEYDLPFEFNFYGRNYSKIYIHVSGFVSFLPLPEDVANSFENVIPRYLPTMDDMNALICPMFGRHVMTLFTDPSISGLFVQEMDDRVIVEWAQYTDMFGIAPPYNFQMILYKSGNIKFQYKDFRANWTSYCSGLENEDGDRAVVISNGEKILSDNMAILMTPTLTQTIEAGQTKSLPLILDASNLNAGIHNGRLRFETNAPANESVELPITLRVSGQAAMSLPSLVDLGDVFLVDDQEDVTARIELKNTGRDILEIYNIEQLVQDKVELYFEYKRSTPWGDMVQLIPVSEFFDYGDYIDIQPGVAGAFVAMVPNPTEGSINESLKFISNVGDATTEMKVRFIYPPSLSISLDPIRVVSLDNTFRKDTIIVISNENGASDLSYNIRLDLVRLNNDISRAINLSAKGASESLGMIEAKSEERAKVSAMSSSTGRTLTYLDEDAGPEGFLGFGESFNFTAGVRYKAPQDGFNLGQVSCWYRPGDLLNSTLMTSVWVGNDDPQKCRLIGVGKIEHNIDRADNMGQWVSIPLDNEIVLYPEETFFIQVHYPLGATNPQAFANVLLNEIEANRYYYCEDLTWSDISLVSGYNTVAYLIELNELESSKGDWISVSNSVGKISAGQKEEVVISFDASLSTDRDNAAIMHIESNDPKNTSASIEVSMIGNKAPVVKLANGASYLHINEGSSYQFELSIVDIENDSFDVEIESEKSSFKIENIDSRYYLSLNPSYDDQGITVVTVKAIDSNNLVGELDIYVEVLNVNRTPIVIFEGSGLEFEKGTFSHEVMMSDIFHDLDGDAMSYEFSVLNEGVVRIFQSSDRFMLMGLEMGDTDVRIVAKDSHGASITMDMPVRITAPTSLGVNSQNKWSVSPNPVDNEACIVTQELFEGTWSYRLFTAQGSLHSRGELSAEFACINLESTPSGNYYLVLSQDDKQVVIKLIKR
ncbi:MAG: S8 family serine peptidase [Bacteroidales bacterium]